MLGIKKVIIFLLNFLRRKIVHFSKNALRKWSSLQLLASPHRLYNPPLFPTLMIKPAGSH